MASADLPHLATKQGLAARWGISEVAAELYLRSDIVDLHVESFSFHRAVGYHLHRRHGRGLLRAQLVGQADLPRLREAGLSGATWSVTANPLRPAEDRERAFEAQFSELKKLLNSADHGSQLVTNATDYQRAKRQGMFASFIGVQGANALPEDAGQLSRYAPELLRITLMHMSDSSFGCTSTPGFSLPGSRRHRRGGGLGTRGFEFMEEMRRLRIGIDLAHVHPRGFWDAVASHGTTQPLFVTHTGVQAVHAHFRNLDDAQLRAVARTGGTVGIMYHALYLGDPLWAGTVSTIAEHILHALSVVGPDHVSLGSDWDGLICTPRDMPTCLELPRLVHALLERAVAPSTVQKILGGNFLRVLGELRGAA